MPTLDEYVLPVRKLTRGSFAVARPYFFLLGSRDPSPDEQEWRFRTQTVSTGRTDVAVLMAREGFVVSSDLLKYEVHPITKTQRNPWLDRVSIGRARNNDVVLLDGSVSKLHAHFHSGSDGRLSVVDAGSRNGTHLNDTRLRKGESAALTPGDKLVFGRVEMLLLDAGALYDFVARFIQPAGP